MSAHKMKTIGYMVRPEVVADLIKQLDKTTPEFTKHEEGSLKDPEGHAITYKYQGDIVFFAMIHSNQNGYLVRAVEGLIEEVK